MSAERQAVLTVERVSTGVARLDHILRGGIPRYSVVFVTGLPGSGKTVLAEQALFPRYVQAGEQVRRAIMALKTRGSAHDRRIRELEIAPRRVAVGRPLSPARTPGTPDEPGAGRGLVPESEGVP